MSNKYSNKKPEKEPLNTLKVEATQYAQGIRVPFGEKPKNVAPIQNDPVDVSTKKP